MAAVLADGQYELDEALVFGNGTTIRVAQVSWDPGSMNTQDAPVVQGDGVRMGADTLPAASLTITGVVVAGNGQGDAALDAYDQLAAAWLADGVRAAPGAYSLLRIRYPGSTGTRAVYGRGRKIAPTLGRVRQGLVDWVGQFDCASPWLYGDPPGTVTLTMMPSDIAGAANLHNRLVNPGFDADVSSWAGTGCALAWSSGVFHTAAGSLRLTPAGAVPGVFTSGNCDNADAVSPLRAYTLALWAMAPATLSVQVQAQIAWLNAGGAVIGTSAGPLTTLAAGTWTVLYAPGNPPAGAVTLDPRLAYAGTPAATDVVHVDDAALIENLGGIAPPVTPPVLLGGTAEAANVIANAGQRRAWPVITITGPVTNPAVAYMMGPVIRLQTAIPAGVTATIDTRPWVRSVTRSDGASLAGAVRGNPLRDLAVPACPTTVRFSGQDPTGTCRCTLTWRTVTGSIGGST